MVKLVTGVHKRFISWYTVLFKVGCSIGNPTEKEGTAKKKYPPLNGKKGQSTIKYYNNEDKKNSVGGKEAKIQLSASQQPKLDRAIYF